MGGQDPHTYMASQTRFRPITITTTTESDSGQRCPTARRQMSPYAVQHPHQPQGYQAPTVTAVTEELQCNFILTTSDQAWLQGSCSCTTCCHALPGRAQPR